VQSFVLAEGRYIYKNKNNIYMCVYFLCFTTLAVLWNAIAFSLTEERLPLCFFLFSLSLCCSVLRSLHRTHPLFSAAHLSPPFLAFHVLAPLLFFL
jgi:hypothetical protein